MKKTRRPKRCRVCKRVIRINNVSGYCSICYTKTEKYLNMRRRIQNKYIQNRKNRLKGFGVL